MIGHSDTGIWQGAPFSKTPKVAQWTNLPGAYRSDQTLAVLVVIRLFMFGENGRGSKHLLFI